MAVRNKWLVLGAAVFGLFMAILDASIVNIAIPSIEQDLETDIETVTWVLNAYNLVFAVLLIPAGRIADRVGRKKLFVAGVIVFSLSSLGAGLSPQIEMLIAWRAVQAAGGAIMVPVSLAIVTLVFPANQRGLALGVWGGMAGVAGAVGPTLGGVLTEYVGWEWVFLVNVPVGLVAVPAILAIVPESRDTSTGQRIDLPGAALLAVALFSLTLALVRGQEVGWSSAFIAGLFATSAVFGALFVAAEAVVSQPIIDLRMLRDRAFAAANATVLLFGIGFFGALFLVVQYLTVVEGYSTLESAFALTPFPACILLTGPVAGRLTDLLGPRRLAFSGVLLFGTALLFLSRLGGEVPYPMIAWRLAIAGVGAGLTFAPLTTAAMGGVAGGRAGVGAGVFNTARQVGFTVGLAILVAVFLGALPSRLSEAQNEAVTVVEQSDLPGPAKEAIAQGILSSPAGQAGVGVRSGTAPEFDLYGQLKRTGQTELAESLRPSLDALSEELRSVFARNTAGAFSRAFLVAAIILWSGLLPAFLVPQETSAGSGPAPPRLPDGAM